MTKIADLKKRLMADPEFKAEYEMADILSLSKARKTKVRAEKEAIAAANRLKFGRTKAEKAKDAASNAVAEKLIDAHKRDS